MLPALPPELCSGDPVLPALPLELCSGDPVLPALPPELCSGDPVLPALPPELCSGDSYSALLLAGEDQLAGREAVALVKLSKSSAAFSLSMLRDPHGRADFSVSEAMSIS